MELAAERPAPMARMTVAAPVTMSPPAQTAFLDVFPVKGSAIIFPHLFNARSGVVLVSSGLALDPTDTTTRSQSILNSLPSMGMVCAGRKHQLRPVPFSDIPYRLTFRLHYQRTVWDLSAGQIRFFPLLHGAVLRFLRASPPWSACKQP